jgi:hypothetical protein
MALIEGTVDTITWTRLLFDRISARISARISVCF